MNNQSNQKELPSIELSLKFMAWDIKQIKEVFQDLNNNVKTLIGLQRTKTPNDAPPF